MLERTASLGDALKRLNENSSSNMLLLFVIDEENKLMGSITDGDIRRGLVNGVTLSSPVTQVMFEKFVFAKKGDVEDKIKTINKAIIKLLPVVDDDGKLVDVINLFTHKTTLPFDAVIMAGGEGRRLRPLTLDTPKPLLKVGDKPIIEHNIDRLVTYGIDRIFLSVKYKQDQLKAYFDDGSAKGIHISYIEEDEPLGTIGSVSLINGWQKEIVLLMNSDLLTNIDFVEMYDEFQKQEADLMVATIPYKVDVPYAVMETENEAVIAFKEKPTYTYQSNAGIYLFKKEMVDLIPKGAYFNATDLMQKMIDLGKKVSYFPILGYWLDIGRHEDLLKAQQDIKHLKL